MTSAIENTEARAVDVPALLSIFTDGVIEGRSGTYRVDFERLEGVYRDREAYRSLLAERGAGFEVYSVQSHSYGDKPGALTIGTSRLEPGRVGDEYALTRGHLHGRTDRAELYYCLSGRGVMLMDTVDGQTSAVELAPGQAAHVPGEWVHRSVNVGDEPFVTLFCYNSDAGQDYGIIERAGGMRRLVVDDGDGGWMVIDNPDHRGYGA
ncbi:glucose-6-phosphate isomerase family protein [Leucobacter sp.]